MIEFFKELHINAKNILEKDPAAKNVWYVILLYPGFHILIFHKFAHWLYTINLKFLARLISQVRQIFYGN